MRFRSPSLSELHAFAAVAELGSFSAAAHVLSVTQGAVSRAVQRLESQLDVALLVRGNSRVEPTPIGAQYLVRIKPALDTLELAVPSRTAPAGHQLRIAPVPSLYARWLVPRLPMLYAEHPKLTIEFRRWRYDDRFERDDTDCWINPKMTVHSRWPEEVTAHYLLGRELVPVCHPSRVGRLRRPKDVLLHPLLHHTAHPGDWALWLKAQSVDTPPARLASGFDLAAALIEGVVADMGVAMVQLCLVEREVASGQLVVPFRGWVSSGRGFYLCRKVGGDSPQFDAFLRWSVAEGRRWRRQALAALP